jgi:hypothetical protein
MAPEDAPLSAAAFRGQQANAALAAALLAAKSEASAAQERVRVAALAWERERGTADALALRVAEAERFLRISSGQPVDPEHGTSSSFQAPPAGSGARYAPTDPMIAQLHLQAAGVQNIRALVSVLLDPASSSYSRWRDQVLLTLSRYALDDHVLVDSPIEARDVAWLRLDSVAMSWIFGTISLDFQDLFRTHGGTARQAWVALEGQFLGNAEYRTLQLDATFRTFVQGDLSVGEYCRRMKSMADALHDLGDPVSDRVLVLNVLRGLSSTYDHLKCWIARQRPFPTFLQVLDDLALEEITRGLTSGSFSPNPAALVATPLASSAAPATSLLGAAPAGQTGGRGGVWTSPAPWWWYGWPCSWGYRYRWPCSWGYQYRWGPSGRVDPGSCSCPCPWRYALAILQQPMVRAHLDVAVLGSSRGASSSAPAGGHVHGCCSTLRAVLDPARSA